MEYGEYDQGGLERKWISSLKYNMQDDGRQ